MEIAPETLTLEVDGVERAHARLVELTFERATFKAHPEQPEPAQDHEERLGHDGRVEQDRKAEQDDDRGRPRRGQALDAHRQVAYRHPIANPSDAADLPAFSSEHSPPPSPTTVALPLRTETRLQRQQSESRRRALTRHRPVAQSPG